MFQKEYVLLKTLSFQNLFKSKLHLSMILLLMMFLKLVQPDLISDFARSIAVAGSPNVLTASADFVDDAKAPSSVPWRKDPE